MPLPTPPGPIDPEDVPNRKWLVFEDGSGDRWMVPGEVDVRNSDGSSATYAADDGAGGPVYLGTDTGVLFFNLDLAAGIVTAITGPAMDVALPADTATELYFQIADIASATAGDFTQALEGPLRWQNSGLPGTWGTQPVVFTVDDGAGGTTEVGRVFFDRGMPVLGEGVEIQVDAAGVTWPASYSGVATAGSYPSQTFDFESQFGSFRYYRSNTDADMVLVHDSYSGNASIYMESTGDPIVARADVVYDTATGLYAANLDAMDDYNGGLAWDYTVT